jgi:hypothetical protein
LSFGRIVSVMLNLNSVGTSNLNSLGATFPANGLAGGSGMAGVSISFRVCDDRCGVRCDGQTSPEGNSAALGEISAAITEVENITATM